MKNVKNVVFMLFIIMILCIIIYAMNNDEYKVDDNKVDLGNNVYIEEVDKIAK